MNFHVFYETKLYYNYFYYNYIVYMDHANFKEIIDFLIGVVL